jgi:hypothetical protein
MPVTEAEWLAATDPERMLRFLRGRASDRKLRLFAVASLRTARAPVGREMLTAVERCTDGELTFSVLRTLFEVGGAEANSDISTLFVNEGRFSAEAAAQLSSFAASEAELMRATYNPVNTIKNSHLQTQCSLLRDIVSSPFRTIAPVTPVSLGWQDATLLYVARAAYDDRRSVDGTLSRQRLAMLADALEDAGCTDAEVLGHLRGPGPHVRGCWAVDLVLGKP